MDTDNYPWYGVQLFGARQNEVGEHLKGKGVESFVPMHEVDFVDRQGKRQHALRPVVNNLLFVKKSIDDKLLKEYMLPFCGHYYIIRKVRGSQDFYEIPACQMREFMIMCDPQLVMKKYISENEAKMKPGSKVYVHHGPLRGLTGRLVRQSGKYYLLKEIPGMAVMIKVTKWCCQKIED